MRSESTNKQAIFSLDLLTPAMLPSRASSFSARNSAILTTFRRPSAQSLVWLFGMEQVQGLGYVAPIPRRAPLLPCLSRRLLLPLRTPPSQMRPTTLLKSAPSVLLLNSYLLHRRTVKSVFGCKVYHPSGMSH